VKNKRKILATAASSRPKRNKGINKPLNQYSLVPASDVESNSSHYSRSASPFLPSDESTDTENSGEEGDVTKNLGKDMSDQPAIGKNTQNHGKETQPLDAIIAPLTKKITADQVGETQTNDTEKQEPSAEA
jgi:ssDNA-binding replication factor A large subunit